MKNNKLSDFIKIRIQIGKSFYIGPGKVILLENIDTLGSISSAAKKLGMSYKKAWRLVKEINSASPNKIILTNTGGKGTGGAKISIEGNISHQHPVLLRSALGAGECKLQLPQQFLQDRKDSSIQT